MPRLRSNVKQESDLFEMAKKGKSWNMWIRVATDLDSVGTDGVYTWAEGEHVKETYFSQEVEDALEAYDFLPQLWKNFDSLLDWGDCDYFFPDTCAKVIPWAQEQLQREDMNDIIRPVYETILEYAEIAVQCQTGLDFY
jgi:hypothetical protein